MTHHNNENSDEEVDFFDDDIGNKDASTVAQATENKLEPQAGEPEATNPEHEIPELKDDEVKEAKAKVASGNDQVNEREKLAIIDEPYIAGQCTTRVTLVISPEDGHEQGPLVFIAAGTHEELPETFLICRLKELTLPMQILDAIASAHGTLSQRGEEKEAARQRAVQTKREAKEKEQQRKQKKQALVKKEAEKKKAEEKRANEPQIMDMFAALG